MYFVNMKVFTNLKWGTRDPVAFKDSELGLIRLRAFGVFNMQVIQPLLFINRMVGTQGVFTTEGIEEYLNRVIVSRFNDFMGETIDSILSLPSKYDEISRSLAARLKEDFAHFGLALPHLYINAITPPPEVQQAIDDRSRMGVFNDMNKLMQMKAAMAMESAAKSEASGQGMGAGLGLMMPAMLAQYFAHPLSRSQNGSGGATPAGPSPEPLPACPECGQAVPLNARFCPLCGHQQLVFEQCTQCGKNLTPGAKFCSRCGQAAEQKSKTRKCTQCGAENLGDAKFCTQCGEKY
jgi:membrane protease subunit (stomatin/prohibitin family)